MVVFQTVFNRGMQKGYIAALPSRRGSLLAIYRLRTHLGKPRETASVGITPESCIYGPLVWCILSLIIPSLT
jgi:hypothetical protein